MPTRAQIVATARSFIGVPFLHQGRSKQFGIDCIGLPIMVGVELGYGVRMETMGMPVRRCNYSQWPQDCEVLFGMRHWLREIPLGSERPGDVLCLWQAPTRVTPPVACHAAIVTDLPSGLGMIHAYSPNKKVIEHGLDVAWQCKIAGVFLFPDVED